MAQLIGATTPTPVEGLISSTCMKDDVASPFYATTARLARICPGAKMMTWRCQLARQLLHLSRDLSGPHAWKVTWRRPFARQLLDYTGFIFITCRNGVAFSRDNQFTRGLFLPRVVMHGILYPTCFNAQQLHSLATTSFFWELQFLAIVYFGPTTTWFSCDSLSQTHDNLFSFFCL